MKLYTGLVQKGAGRGRQLGYPTANISLTDAESGIFAGRVRVEDKEYRAAVFADPTRKILEAHLLDFSGDLYGKEVSIELCTKIRESEEFTTDDALRAAIGHDVEMVRQYFNT